MQIDIIYDEQCECCCDTNAGIEFVQIPFQTVEMRTETAEAAIFLCGHIYVTEAVLVVDRGQ